jgi:hypothetical protein
MLLLEMTWLLPKQVWAASPISFLQAATGSSDGQSSSLSASAITTTAGNLLIAAVTWDATSAGTVSLSDSKGNTWTAATTRQVDVRNKQALQIFYARNIAGGSTTVRAIPSPAASWVRLIVHEVAGADLTAPLDQTTVNNAGSGSSITVGPITTSASGEYVFTAAMNDGSTPSASFSAATGYTKRAVAASAHNELASADQVQSAAGPVSSTWKLSSSSSSLAQMASFKAGGASAPVITSFLANPSTISAGQSAVLSWAVSGNPSPTLSIDNGVGTVTGNSTVVAPETTTTYTLTAINASGSATSQTTVTLAQPDSTAPSIPASLVATTVSSSQISISWANSIDPVINGQVSSGVAAYEVYRNGSAIATTPATFFIDSGLTASTTYSYSVSAIDAAGNMSPPSASISAGTFGSSLDTAYPLKPSSNGRYLVDQSNIPFLVIGDAPHSLIVNLSNSDAAMYLMNRSSNGVNSIWVEALCVTYTGGRANGSMLDGTTPFTGTLSGGYWDLTTPREAYWSHVDYIVQTAATNGIQVLLTPLDEGGLSDTALQNGTARCRQYGQFLGNRYKNYPNILWQDGNDFQLWRTASYDAVITSIALGIRETSPNELHTIELDYYISDSLEDPNWGPIVSVNGVYTYFPTYDECLLAYNRANFMPVLFLEEHYEYEDVSGELGTPKVLRRQEYWSLLSGSLAGHMYGNYYTWTFNANWKSYLNSPGMAQLGYFKNFCATVNWYDLIPDQAHLLLTGGYGTYATSGNVSANDYATAARSSDGRTAVIYMPTARTFSVDLTKLNGPATCWWFDPSAGTYNTIPGSPFNNTGTLNFSSPGNNRAGDADWILVLQAN